MKLWEKIFITCNIIFIVSVIGIYVFRGIKYYRLTNVIDERSKLVDILDKKVIYKGDGLYKEDDIYYFKGKDVNNYILYNNILYRIVSMDKNGIKIISDDNLTTLSYVNNTYKESNIYNYLNGIYSENDNLVSTNFCNIGINVNEYECNDYVSSYAGLLDSSEYLRASGINSYLNNNTYFWLVNSDLENNKLYVNSTGGINNKDKENGLNYSYGIRPVIVLNKNIRNISGDGSIDNPYIVSNNSNAIIKDHNIGTYVQINDKVFRILSIEENYTRLIYDGVLEPQSYSKATTYINNDFIKDYKDILVKGNCNINTYNKSNNYSLDKKTSSLSYACLPNVGDLFITEYDGIWLNTKYNNSLNYVINKTSLFADLKTSLNKVRPIIHVSNELIISSGKGTKNNPLVLGDVNETNN